MKFFDQFMVITIVICPGYCENYFTCFLIFNAVIMCKINVI